MAAKKKQSQVKSKQRVSDFGEVYTAPAQVNAMLDLVKAECNKIDSTFLEPACGNGNFLVEILARKLAVVKKKFGKVQKDYEINMLIAIGSIYGIDILPDNCEESRSRMYSIVEKEYKKRFKKDIDIKVLESAKYMLSQNIIAGDGLSGLCLDGQPIMFPQWNPVIDKFKREDYAMCDLFAYSDLENKKTHITEPRKVYPLVHYKSLTTLREEA
jgi:hypothetical protein